MLHWWYRPTNSMEINSEGIMAFQNWCAVKLNNKHNNTTEITKTECKKLVVIKNHHA